MADAPSPQQLAQQNASIRAMILANGISRLQQISSAQYDPAAQSSAIIINPQNVGLIRGFLVKVKGTFHNSDGAAGVASLTNLGASNILSQIAFADFNNITRIQTTGWHLNLLASAKNNMVFGGAYAPNVPEGFGNNYPVQKAPATIAAGADGDFTFFYYVPLAYAKNDLRGAVYAGLIGATSRLELTLNANPFSPDGSDALAVYKGVAGGWKAGSKVQVTVFQDYIDQLPMQPGGNTPYLPPIDLSTIYDLKNTSASGFVANQDFGIGFANFRTFLSMALIYDNGTQLNAGTDITSFALTLANASNIWKYGPEEAAMLARGQFMCDPPTGVYWFDSRQAPINTQQWGNAQLTVNPSVVNANAAFLIGYEAFAMTQTIGQAGSLISG